MRKHRKVIILGGGVAGMSAAHELAERGFEVDVYELHAIPGGKARSMPYAETGPQGKELPAEHGFRFFPGFYQHLCHTMQRIPYQNKNVYKNLVDTTRSKIVRSRYPDLTTMTGLPKTWADVKSIWKTLRQFVWHPEELGLQTGEAAYFLERLWQVITTCEERRLEEYDRIGWWEFIEAEDKSAEYQSLFGNLSRTLVAAQASKMSAKTGGDIMIQLLLDILNPGVSADRVLNGPTNHVWIYPWLRYLIGKGVNYHIHARVQTIQCDAEHVRGVTMMPADEAGVSRVLACTDTGITRVEPVYQGAESFVVEGDYYLAALPVEAMAKLLSKEMLRIDPTLEHIRHLQKKVASMNGIMFYLNTEIKVVHGHVNYIDTPWALTSISQQQFWPDIDLRTYGNGRVRDILSVDISDWKTPGLHGKSAEACETYDDIQAEVWRQLKRSLNAKGAEILKDEYREDWFIARDIVVPVPSIAADASSTQKIRFTNREPLLVNATGTWHLRPEAFTRIPNLFLASDYVRTNTDLATMEAANEAARRATNCILDLAKQQYGIRTRPGPCKIWRLHEPWSLALWRWRDRHRNWQGLPWSGQMGTVWVVLLVILSSVFFIGEWFRHALKKLLSR